MMHKNYARQLETCPSGREFYECAIGPFTGCCSTNPCDMGVCDDDGGCDESSSITEVAPLPPNTEGSSPNPANLEETTTVTITVSDILTSTYIEATATVAASQITSDATAAGLLPPISSIGTLSSALRSSTSTDASFHNSAVQTSLVTPSSTYSPTSSATNRSTASSASTTSSSKSHPAPSSIIVGGVVGGVAFLCLLLLLLCCCCRRRKKYGVGFERKNKKDKEIEEQLRKAETAAAERESFLNAVASRAVASSPAAAASTSITGPTYPRNSTAAPPPQWI